MNIRTLLLFMLCFSYTLCCNQHKTEQLWLQIEQIDNQIVEMYRNYRKFPQKREGILENLQKLDGKKQQLHDELKKLYN